MCKKLQRVQSAAKVAPLALVGQQSNHRVRVIDRVIIKSQYHKVWYQSPYTHVQPPVYIVVLARESPQRLLFLQKGYKRFAFLLF